MKHSYLVLLLTLLSFHSLSAQEEGEILIDGLTRPNKIIADGSVLYFTNAGMVMSYDLMAADSPLDTLVTSSTSTDLSDLVLVGNDLYVASYSFDGDQIFAFNPAEEEPTIRTILSDFDPVNGLIESDSTLYFTTFGSSVWSFDLRASNPTPRLIVENVGSSGPLSLNGTKLYVSAIAVDSLSLIDLDNNPPFATSLVPNIARPLGQIIFEGRLIVASYTEGKLLSYNLSDFSAAPGTAAVLNTPVDMVIIGSDLYVTSIPLSGPGSIVRFTAPPLAGDRCVNANDINGLLGQGIGVAQTSTLYDNADYDAESDPGTGFECFGEPDSPTLNRTIWFSFTGDGQSYRITTVRCDATNYISFGDTQIAIYSGDNCDGLTPVACAEDRNTNELEAELQFPTEDGVEYRMIVDGFGADFSDIGEFCLEVTELGPSGVTDVQDTPTSIYPNPTTGLLQLRNVEAQNVEVFNHLGSRIAAFAHPGTQVDISAFPAGMYVLRLEDKKGRFFSARVIKK